MMLLVALAITVAFLASWAATLGLVPHDLDFWWELALLVVIMLLGHWVEMRSLAQTASALDSLAALLPDEAERVRNGQLETVTPDQLEVGDVVVVRPGGRIPADGRVVDGSAAVDESMITGESRAVRRDVGSTVVAGTVATDSGIRVEVTATGEDTALAGISKARRRRAGIRIARPAAGRHRRRLAVLVRPGRRDHHRGRLVPAGITRRGRHPHHHRARHRLPPPHWDWRSRWSSPSPPSARHARGCS